MAKLELLIFRNGGSSNQAHTSTELNSYRNFHAYKQGNHTERSNSTRRRSKHELPTDRARDHETTGRPRAKVGALVIRGGVGAGFGRVGAYRDLVERDDGLEVDVVPRRRRRHRAAPSARHQSLAAADDSGSRQQGETRWEIGGGGGNKRSRVQ